MSHLIVYFSDLPKAARESVPLLTNRIFFWSLVAFKETIRRNPLSIMKENIFFFAKPKILTRWVQIMKKTGGRKSRDTLPLSFDRALS